MKREKKPIWWNLFYTVSKIETIMRANNSFQYGVLTTRYIEQLNPVVISATKKNRTMHWGIKSIFTLRPVAPLKNDEMKIPTVNSLKPALHLIYYDDVIKNNKNGYKKHTPTFHMKTPE